jgi:hypothetical protein
MLRTVPPTLLVAALALLPRSASAGAASDLAACQRVVASASAKHLQAVTKAVDACLKKVSAKTIAGGLDVTAAANASATTCATAFRKIRNAAMPRKQLATLFDARVDRACDPTANPALAHAEADTWTVGSTTLGSASLGSYCRHFGGSGSIASFAAWRDCLRSATECQARQMIAARWPRALESLAALKVALAALPDAADALAALTAFDAALEGTRDDDLPEADCAKPIGLLQTGMRACAAEPTSGSTPSTGFTGCLGTFATGQDGFYRVGVPFDLTDNGDGTITDHVTGLMWEKLGDDGGIHDVDRAGDWATLTAAKIAELNASAFAGHTDWRTPNRRELESLVKIDSGSPTTDAVFHTGCTPGCSPTMCSCTARAAYWSSSAYAGAASHRWVVSFEDGSLTHVDKGVDLYRHRAVRGGLVIR